MSDASGELFPGNGTKPPAQAVRLGAGRSPTDVLRVLLVDDNAHVLRFLTSAFKMHDCLVSTAATAEQALDVLSDTLFDLVEQRVGHQDAGPQRAGSPPGGE